MPNHIKNIRIYGASLLKNAKIESYAFESDILLTHVLHKPKLFLLTYPDYVLNNNDVTAFFDLISRRCNHEPLQYITGHQEFMGIDISVTPDVLIPRQDTEVLVQTLLDLCGTGNVEILDLCCGSGCVGVSVAFYHKNSMITFSDVSERAIEICKINATNANVSDRSKFFIGDLFEPLINHRFDYIISNPPYISKDDFNLLHKQVKDYEPTIALLGGNDGFDFYRKIISTAPLFLSQNGTLLLEVGINQAAEVSKLMEDKFTSICNVKDLNYIDRVVYGKLK